MFVTVVAVLCRLVVADPTASPQGDCTPEEARVEEIVTDSSMDERVDFFSCQIGGQQALAQWKNSHPIYRRNDWRIARLKCCPGHYEIKGSV